MTMSTATRTLEDRARRAAKRAGLSAHKSRDRHLHCNNEGGFMLVDDRNCVVAGERFDMSAEEVVSYCKPARGKR